MIFYSPLICDECKAAVVNPPPITDSNSDAVALELDDLDQLLEDGRRARGYLYAYNSHPEHGAANSVFLLPSADEKLERQRNSDVEDLKQFLIAEAKTAFGLGPPEQDPAAREGVADPSNRLGAACSACRGQCCFTGLASHAFLGAQELRAPLFDQPDLSADEIVDFYTNFLPDQHVAGSCLYHSSAGCALPRWARADLCGTYLCGTVKVFLDNTKKLCRNHVHLVVADSDEGVSEAILHLEMKHVMVDGLSSEKTSGQ